MVRFFKRPPLDLEPYVQAALRAGRDAVVESSRSSAGIDLRQDLPRISVPTLIVQGGLDPSRTPELGAEMAKLIPRGKLHVVEGVGHTPMLEDPEAWRRVFQQFLDA